MQKKISYKKANPKLFSHKIIEPISFHKDVVINQRKPIFRFSDKT